MHLTEHRNPFGQFGNTGLWPLTLRPYPRATVISNPWWFGSVIYAPRELAEAGQSFFLPVGVSRSLAGVSLLAAPTSQSG
jgi:hypothetical protein